MDIKKLLIILGGTIAVVLIVVFVFMTFIGGEEANKYTISAKQALEQNQQEEALNILLDGQNNKELDKEGNKFLSQLKKEFYSIYLEDGKSAEKNENYLNALEKYRLALKVIPPNVDSDSVEESIARMEELAKALVLLQKDYDLYMETFNVVLDESNKLLEDYKAQLDGLEVGQITAKKFVSHIKTKIALSHDILIELDKGLSANNESLLNVHKQVVSLINFQHNMFLESLNVTKNSKAQLLVGLKGQYASIKQPQITIIQTLNQFAEENNLETTSARR